MFPRNLRQYGLTLEDYRVLLTAQDSVCAICKQPETSRRLGRLRRLCIDHDHQTGEVRGLLCNRCNRALGLLEDSTDSRYAAIEYLCPGLEVRSYLEV